jgi:hypothetical protein
MTNLHRFNFGWTCSINKLTGLTADYHAMFADENTKRGKAGFSMDGKFRGSLFTSRLDRTFNKHMKGHLVGEFFFPGSYSSETARDMAMFLRAELLVSW